MRPWWIYSIKTILESNCPYADVSLNNPPPIFKDKTADAKKYNDDFGSGSFTRIVNAMNNEEIINANILCPWGCSVSFRDAGMLPLDLIYQKILPKIILKLYSDK